MYRSEHPKPQFMRENWMNLNGKWQFEFDFSNSGKEKEYYRNDIVYNDVIEVPFCPESKLSGIQNVDFLNAVWYRREVTFTEEQLKNSRYNSAQLKKTLDNLKAELETRQQQIATLQSELAAKNIRISELDDAVAGLTKNVDDLSAENAAKSATVASQDKALNTAWFVFGTKSELKDQKILQKGDVLKNADFNKDYFTQIDIRTDKEIKLYSKRAELLTTHPVGSYEWVKDAKGQLELKITNPNEFWSVSRYLVIQVK